VGSNQAITATMLLVSTVITVPVTSTKRTSEDRARVLMGLNRPPATVTRLPVRTTRTPVPATSTRGTSVVPSHAMELGRTITATSLLARVTRTLRNATSIGRTSDLLAHVLVGLSQPLATVIRIPVMTTRTMVLVIRIER